MDDNETGNGGPSVKAVIATILLGVPVGYIIFLLFTVLAYAVGAGMEVSGPAASWLMNGAMLLGAILGIAAFVLIGRAMTGGRRR